MYQIYLKLQNSAQINFVLHEQEETSRIFRTPSNYPTTTVSPNAEMNRLCNSSTSDSHTFTADLMFLYPQEFFTLDFCIYHLLLLFQPSSTENTTTKDVINLYAKLHTLILRCALQILCSIIQHQHICTITYTFR